MPDLRAKIFGGPPVQRRAAERLLTDAIVCERAARALRRHARGDGELDDAAVTCERLARELRLDAEVHLNATVSAVSYPDNGAG